ncbi:Serine/threonine-protein phosphatase 2A activator 2 [Serendipita sp. 399]|nr:Serine/threonine-protein phosphatase 2A activator 2 [Serendipita sp. 399]
MSATETFEPPTKAILSPHQLEQFQTSQTHASVVAYIQRLNDAVTGVKLRDSCFESEAVRKILEVLDAVGHIAEETPAVDNKGSRFGNPAFREVYDKIKVVSLFSPFLSLPISSLPFLILEMEVKLTAMVTGLKRPTHPDPWDLTGGNHRAFALFRRGVGKSDED